MLWFGLSPSSLYPGEFLFQVSEAFKSVVQPYGLRVSPGTTSTAVVCRYGYIAAGVYRSGYIWVYLCQSCCWPFLRFVFRVWHLACANGLYPHLGLLGWCTPLAVISACWGTFSAVPERTVAVLTLCDASRGSSLFDKMTSTFDSEMVILYSS